MRVDMKNPFPGMNPWLEDYWRDVHASLLVYARDQLNEELPPGLQARVDERLAIDAEDNSLYIVSPDRQRLLVGSLAERKVIAEIDVGKGPYWVAVMGER